MRPSVNIIFSPVCSLFGWKCNHIRTASMYIPFNTSDVVHSLPKLADAHHPRLYVVGNGAKMASKCVMLKQGTTRILFNCGESADFKGVPDSICVTHIGWDKIGGISSVIYKAASSKRSKISLSGPPGLDYFVRAAESFVWLYQKFTIDVADPKSPIHSVNDNFTITCVPIKSASKKVYNPPPIDKSLLRTLYSNEYRNADEHLATALMNESLKLSNKFDFNTSNSYIYKSVGCKSWLFSECAKKGVKPGEEMLKLWHGESITTDDGSVITPEEVISFTLCPAIIIIDCPSEDFLDDLLIKDDYTMYYNESVVIVHFTPMAVMHDIRYVSWMNRFKKNIHHVVVNESNEWESSPKVLNKQKICKMINPHFFPGLRQPKEQKSINLTPESLDDLPTCDGIMVVKAAPSEEWLRKWSNELRNFNLVQSQSGTNINLTTLEVERYFEPFEISCLPAVKNHSDFPKGPLKFSPKNPRITFLGTASQAGSGYRNASGILVQMSSDSSMLMDCGDGIVKQFATLFNDKDLLEVLTSLKCIYISHTHADHHAGLVGVLLSIRNAWKSLGLEPQKLVCLVPTPIIGWLQNYHKKFEPILEHVLLINLADLISRNLAVNRELNNFLMNHFGMKRTRVCWAIHSVFSYCVTFEHSAGWQISYSGDTSYNSYFVEMGRNSDLLIHEATYGTGLDKMAKKARHSTTAQAIRAGKEMRAKHVILTHFSRRYPIIPCLQDLKNTKNVGVAMDFLQVNLSDLHLLPKLHKDYEEVFDLYERENIDRNEFLKKRNY